MARLGLVLVAASALAGCRLDLAVHVTVDEDGSGSVEVVGTIDRDGIDRLGGDLDAVLLVDDLVAAGWAVDGPEVGADGSAEVRFSRPFAIPEEAAAIFTDIAGPAGPFQDFAVGRSTSFARTEWTFDGRIDASGGLEAFGDADLAAELDGEPLGLTPEEIEKALGDPLEEVIRLRVEARLPGDVTSNGDTEDGVAAWEVPFGDGPVDLAADGTETRWVSLVAGGLAVVCLVALLIHAIIRLVARRRAGRPAEPAHRTEQP